MPTAPGVKSPTRTNPIRNKTVKPASGTLDQALVAQQALDSLCEPRSPWQRNPVRTERLEGAGNLVKYHRGSDGVDPASAINVADKSTLFQLLHD